MTRKQDRLSDRNFDDLAMRFDRNIYSSLKGKIRLRILQRDLQPFLLQQELLQQELQEQEQQKQQLDILDAGGGQGHFSLPLTQQGHRLTLCDISEKMLERAKEAANQLNASQVEFLHCSFQELSENSEHQYDLILCHAVLEWLAKPEEAIQHLLANLRPGGILSLMFYNTNSIVLKNALRTNYQKIIDDDYHGYRGSLTPIHPLYAEEVIQWCHNAGLTILAHSGVRVFYDYRMDPETRDNEEQGLLEAELKFSTIEPFRSLGRYIHLVAQKAS